MKKLICLLKGHKWTMWTEISRKSSWIGITWLTKVRTCVRCKKMDVKLEIVKDASYSEES